MIMRLLAKGAGKLADVLEPMAESACAELAEKRQAEKERLEELENRLAAVLAYAEELEQTTAAAAAELENERQRCERQATELTTVAVRRAQAEQAASGWREQCGQMRRDYQPQLEELQQLRRDHRAMVLALSGNVWFVAVPPGENSDGSICTDSAEIYASFDHARKAHPGPAWKVWEASIL